MRRNFYISFAIVLMATCILLLLLNAPLVIFFTIFTVLLLVALIDMFQRGSSLRRNFPILGNTRYILEFIRPEIQQYFIASDTSEKPYDRETRSLIYQRSKKAIETIPFGCHRDLSLTGTEWVQHSLQPVDPNSIQLRTQVGLPDCKQPYEASILNISAMSYGALSKNAISALNLGAMLGGFAHNTGEGGISNYHLLGGDLVWQIGTGYFGCRDKAGNFDPELFKAKAQHDSVKMIEIKLSQGAKPSHGGILPAAKITDEIAAIRHVDKGADINSPPTHSAFSTPIELLHFIENLRSLSDGKPVGFKLAIGRFSEFLAICKAMTETGIKPDFITIDGAEGGTGAAPVEFANNIGTPLDVALNFVNNALIGTNLRDGIKIIAAGRVATGFDMVTKFALGADLCNSARAFMMALGCIQSLQCHSNHCPTGVATQNRRLTYGLSVTNKKQRVANYHAATIHSCAEILGAMGFSSADHLSPVYVQRRVGQGMVSTYADIYEQLEPGQLLSWTGASVYSHAWAAADAASF